jgi:Tol biopolymer transport system component
MIKLMGAGEYIQPRLSADGRKLVATLVEIRQALVRVPVTGGPSSMYPITDGYSGDLDPSLDPRGARLVFSSSRSGHRNVWIARSDGSEARPLTTATSLDERPAFSPDGEQVAFISDRSGQRAICDKRRRWGTENAGETVTSRADLVVG